jgi:hypothetical protein
MAICRVFGIAHSTPFGRFWNLWSHGGGHCRAARWCLQRIYPQEVWSNTMLFLHLRTVMKALKFTSGDDVQETVTRRFTQPPVDFFAHETCRLVHQWGLLSKCLLCLFVTQQLYPWAPSNGFQLYMPDTYLETTCMRLYIQTGHFNQKLNCIY